LTATSSTARERLTATAWLRFSTRSAPSVCFEDGPVLVREKRGPDLRADEAVHKARVGLHMIYSRTSLGDALLNGVSGLARLAA